MHMAGLFKKAYYVNMSCKNHFKLQNSNTASWLKIQVDSIFTEQPDGKSGKTWVRIHLVLP